MKDGRVDIILKIHFFLNLKKIIVVESTYNVILVSTVQQGGSVIHASTLS